MPIPIFLLIGFALTLSLTSTSTAESSGTSPAEDARAEAVLLTDFKDEDRNARWAVVNDNVMGGRSDGEMAMDIAGPGVMTLTGDINTNGGGFTSVRMAVDPTLFADEAEASVLAELRAVRLRVRGEAESLKKPFALRLEDAVPRRRGINFRAVLPLDSEADPQEWQTVTVSVESLRATHHGRRLNPADWAPLDTSRLNRVGVILNDVGDGPYRLEIDRIELMR